MPCLIWLLLFLLPCAVQFITALTGLGGGKRRTYLMNLPCTTATVSVKLCQLFVAVGCLSFHETTSTHVYSEVQVFD